ncbi:MULTISPECIES: hypothetical protein [Inquilinus]|jgi:hypothetical protein|uniref:Uncharacterized protein n=1 Tax=Inquilinus ginsengisoli TaxID=363840 RepID=A0ABU1JLX2_9PROT|nr:hypothetical protein [Inquilinus ginsengisoli]MDR6289607.1 hypothetical protein [Inquilinus ginsengisoli]
MTFAEFFQTPAAWALLFALLAMPALARMLGRAGFARGWAVLALVPHVGVLLVFALLLFRRWPAIAALGEAKR